jgi:hypothetical protein
VQDQFQRLQTVSDKMKLPVGFGASGQEAGTAVSTHIALTITVSTADSPRRVDTVYLARNLNHRSASPVSGLTVGAETA